MRPTSLLHPWDYPGKIPIKHMICLVHWNDRIGWHAVVHSIALNHFSFCKVNSNVFTFIPNFSNLSLPSLSFSLSLFLVSLAKVLTAAHYYLFFSENKFFVLLIFSIIFLFSISFISIVFACVQFVALSNFLRASLMAQLVKNLPAMLLKVKG